MSNNLQNSINISTLYNGEIYHNAIGNCHPGYKEMQRKMFELIISYSKGKKIVNIFNIGSGTGLFEEFFFKGINFQEPEFYITSLEKDEYWFSLNKNICKEFESHINFINSDFFSDSLKLDKKFDIILLSFSFHHFPFDKQKEILTKLKNILSDDGIILIGEEIIPNFSNDDEKIFAHKIYHSYVIAFEEKMAEMNNLSKIDCLNAAAIETISMLANIKSFGEYKVSYDEFLNLCNDQGMNYDIYKIFPEAIEKELCVKAKNYFIEGKTFQMFYDQNKIIKEITIPKISNPNELSEFLSYFDSFIENVNWGIFVFVLKPKR